MSSEIENIVYAPTGQESALFEYRAIHSGKTVVSVKHNGDVEFGEGVTPEGAAKVFWSEVEKLAKAPRTISRDEYENYKFETKHSGYHSGLATLGITVREE